jgi:hypothetical protein
MSESQNYFETNFGFEHTVKYLKKSGYLLVFGKFRKSDSKEFHEVTNIYDEYIKTANLHRFKLLKSEDTTKHILPTLELARKYYEEYGLPIFKLGKYYINKNKSIKTYLLKFFIKLFYLLYKKRVSDVTKYYKQHLDVEYFQRYIEYKILLFRRG